jgi:opacity protein-like surface antigen
VIIDTLPDHKKVLMKKLLILSITILPLFSYSQRLHVNLFAGFTNYQGDLQEKPLTFEQSNGGFGAGLKYDLNSHFSLRSGFMYGKVGADDKRNKNSLRLRNLNFESKIVEGNFMLEYNLLDITDRRFTPYAFAGVALYHFNPYSYDTVGNKVFLRPLSTEGQGLSAFPDNKPYKLTRFAVPFGGGLKMRLTDNVTIAYEIGLRKLNTDYLDDVSTRYVDQTLLLAERGPKAVEMAYRGDELKDGNPLYPAGGTLRGGEKQKDWYYFQGININIGINTGNFLRSSKSRLDCPGRVL